MIFNATISQMVFLFFLVVIGYILSRFKLIPENAETTLSKLENYIFIPALIMGTFVKNLTVESLFQSKNLLLGSILIEIVVISVSMLLVKLLSKDKYTQNIFLYGLCFSNFGFMGNAVVSALFPEIFMEYLLFTLVLWTAIYIWGVPILLLSDTGIKGSFLTHFKNFLNPMFISMTLGMIWGVSSLPVPDSAQNLLDGLGSCMSPIAMLLTGITIAKSKLSEVLKPKNIYIVSLVRLVVYPMIFIGLTIFFKFDDTLIICAVCSLAMPLGLNTIVIPSAYGKDTKTASGMMIVSHLFSCITIPIIFTFIFVITFS